MKPVILVIGIFEERIFDEHKDPKKTSLIMNHQLDTCKSIHYDGLSFLDKASFNEKLERNTTKYSIIETSNIRLTNKKNRSNSTFYHTLRPPNLSSYRPRTVPYRTITVPVPNRTVLFRTRSGQFRTRTEPNRTRNELIRTQTYRTVLYRTKPYCTVLESFHKRY